MALQTTIVIVVVFCGLVAVVVFGALVYVLRQRKQERRDFGDRF